jgi:hypothetical protein
LSALLKGAGWRVRSPKGADPGWDLLAETDGHRYVAQLKLAHQAWRPLLEGLLSSAILRARPAAAAMNAKPLAIVCAPSISDAMLAELGNFVDRFGEGVAWGAMDEHGLVALHGPGLQQGFRRQRRAERGASPVARRSDVLSDLGQWMLKVVLSHALPVELRMTDHIEHTRIDEPIRNARALAEVAGTSTASAARFVASLRAERLLAESGALSVVGVEELLDRWRAVYRRPPAEVRARWLFPSRNRLNQLDKLIRGHPQKPGTRACLGLFAACERLGFRFVSGVAPHLYLEKPSAESLQQLGLRIAEPGEAADVIVREPRFPEAVFRGAAPHDGVAVADVLQCWLDVSDHPARGDEMAAHLFDRVLGPSLLASAP